MANVKHNLLSAIKVKTLTTSGTYTDGATLTLRVSDTGNKRWVQRIAIDGKQRNIGLGAYPAVGLAEARTKAQENARAVRESRNPIEEKREARRESRERAALKTFWEIAQEVIEKNNESWTTPKSKQRWTSTLLRYAVPVIGDKRPRDITVSDIEQVLEPIWLSKKDTASRLRQQIGAVFEYAMAREWCQGNPAGTPVLRILPKRPKKGNQQFRTMPYADLPAALNAVHDSTADFSTKLAVEFLALTSGRSGETRKAVWSEIDLAGAKWVIPAARMKSRKEHRVPLSDRVLEILEKARELKSNDDLIFPSRNTGRPYSDSTFSKLFRELEIPAVPHGMRSCFKNWTREELPNPDHVMVEIAMAHEVGTEVEKAYGTSDMFEKRRALMQEWADFLTAGMERSRWQQTTMELI